MTQKKQRTPIKDAYAEKLAITARASIGDYCHSECKASCCRKGYLLLTAKEVKLLSARKKDLKTIPVELEIGKRGYVFELGAKNAGCPHLQDYKCMIHKNPCRPKACKEFPLFIWEKKTVMVTYACPAVKENMLYPYLAEFKKKGYKLKYIAGKD